MKKNAHKMKGEINFRLILHVTVYKVVGGKNFMNEIGERVELNAWNGLHMFVCCLYVNIPSLHFRLDPHQE